jgi:hypothetical protein
MNEDFNIDVKNLLKDVNRMIHPIISEKMRNKGITIFLSSIVGYDCEYELESSLKKLNNLLSIQIASNTSFYVKIPLIDKDPLKPYELFVEDKPL